jgi:Flp pilus assembly pilin Flp
MRSASASLFAFFLSRLSRKEGQTLVEYALILAILSVAMIACFTLLGNKIVVVFSAITNILDTAQGSH